MEENNSVTRPTEKKVFVALADFGSPDDAYASEGGHGVSDIFKVVNIFEHAGITCCMVGIAALKWFGAGRVRWDWEICIPTEKLEQAAAMLRSEPYNRVYEPWRPEQVQLRSLHHTFPRFKPRSVNLRFQILPSEDCHFNCNSSQIERSPLGIPYPKLEPFAQSLLKTQKWIDIDDLVDGMNISEEWGEKHLNLDKTVDLVYATKKNEKIMASVPPGEDPFRYAELPLEPICLRELWQDAVRGKKNRISKGLPTDLFATRFFAYGQGDPRLNKDRTDV